MSFKNISTTKTFFLFFAILIASLVLFNIWSVPLFIDTSFGKCGKLTTEIGPGKDVGYSVAVQPDSKVVVAGWTTKPKSYYKLTSVAAGIAQNGTGGGNRGFDASFIGASVTGFVGTDTSDQGYGYFPAVIASGKKYRITATLLASGGVAQNIITSNGTNFVRDQVQLITNAPATGSYEFTAMSNATYIGFGTSYSSGTLSLTVSDFKIDEVTTLATAHKSNLDGDPASTNSSAFLQTDFAVVRYNANGTLDTTFGTNGVVTTDIGSGNDQAFSVVVQHDGKLVVAGTSTTENKNFAVVRYNPDGTLDTMFGTGGVLSTRIGLGDNYGYSVALQPNGKIVVAGHTYNGKDFDIAVVRYHLNGTLDTTFGRGGIATTAIGSADDEAYSIVVQPDGKIVVAGSSRNATNVYNFAVVRYSIDGSLDTAFGLNGKLTTAIVPHNAELGNNQATGVTLQPDGKIIVVGYTDAGFAIARYTLAGVLDTTFGVGGIATTDIGIGKDEARGVVLQADGKIVVIGKSIRLNTGMDVAVVRYNADGTLDATFGAGGKITTDFSASYDVGNSIALQPDGRAVVAGYSKISSYDFAVLQYDMVAGDASYTTNLLCVRNKYTLGYLFLLGIFIMVYLFWIAKYS